MKKINILGFLSVLGLLIVIPTLFVIKFIPSETNYKTVKISDINIKAEVADTTVKMQTGDSIAIS